MSEPANIIAKFNGQNTYDYSGYSLSRDGDADADVFGDLLISFPCHGATYQGSAYFIYGNPNLRGDYELSDTGTGFALSIFNRKNNYDQSGFCISYARDVNNEGYGDIMVGAPFVRTAPYIRQEKYTSYSVVTPFSGLIPCPISIPRCGHGQSDH
ncbi:MAG: hypothetical protein ACMUHX_00820 [bacterium]